MMSQGQLDRFVQQVRQLADGPAARPSDALLLERFVRQADQSAFAELVARHGAMVLAVCRRVLGNHHEAEDAFQATWLVLARKAAAVRWSDSVAGWLHAVAVRVAGKARGQSARRQETMRKLAAMPQIQQAPEPGHGELLALVQSELARLPEAERSVLVLCYLEGKTNAQAADELGCPLGSMSGRLRRAREMLRQRLEGRGCPVSPAALPVLLGPAVPAVPETLARGTVAAAALLAGGTAVGTVASTAVAALVEATLREMTLKSVRALLLAGLTILALAAGVGLLGYRTLAGARPDDRIHEQSRPAVKPPAAQPAAARTFQSTLPLAVVQVVEGEAPRQLGWTGLGEAKAIHIPAGAVWYVQPPALAGLGLGGGQMGGVGLLGGAAGVGGLGGIQPGANVGIGPGGGGAFVGKPPAGKFPAGKGPFLLDAELTGKKLDALIAEMNRQSIPGLRVEGMKMGDAELARLAAVPSLRALLLRGTQVTDQGLGKLSSARSLRFLALEDTPITDRGLARLGQVRSLRRLHLSGKRIDDRGMQKLGEVKELRHLRLHDTGVTGKGLAALKELPHLQTLEWSGPLDDRDMEALAQLPALRTLRLYQTGIGDDGLARLAGLGKLRSLTLDAHWNQGTMPFPFGVGLGGIAGGPGTWVVPRQRLTPTGEIEDLPPPRFGGKGLARLPALQELAELHVRNEKLTDDDLATLGRLTGLTRLGVFAPEVTDRGIAELKGLKKLQGLDLRGTRMTTGAAATLRTLPRLRSLRTNLSPFDPNYRASQGQWKRALPGVAIEPAWDLPGGQLVGGFGFGGGFGGGGILGR